MGAKDVLTAKSGAGNDYLDGSTSRLIMIKMSLQELRKRRRRFREIPMYFCDRYRRILPRCPCCNRVFIPQLLQCAAEGEEKTPEIYFVGNSISSKYIHDLQDVLEGKDFSINIISKSGTTTEPAIAFRVFKEMLIRKYGKEEANKRIYATTDKAKGALKNLDKRRGIRDFVVPDDVGGRFSVLTAVGLYRSQSAVRISMP